VKVGPKKKPFLIHKDLLVFYSDYFRGAFNGSFSEATKGSIYLADERVDVFTIVNQFVYTRQLSEKLDSDLEWEMLARIWLFGDKYLMPSLQNRVMDMLIEKNANTGTIPSFLLTITYNNAPPGSPLRKFLTYLVAYKCDPVRDITLELSRRWPHEALFDLLMVVAAKK
jgi:hypothetical protein